MHQWDSVTLKFEKVFDRRKNFQAGPFTFSTVQKGDVGVSFDRGELVLLPAGYHVLKHALHKFSHNLSVRQQFDRLLPSCCPPTRLNSTSMPLCRGKSSN